MNDAESDSIRAHVSRISSSELFAGAERLCRFLHFTVESKLSGREDRVKEYAIGREVFDRGADYDPRIDPIVRVEARRLRSRLTEYYAGPGREEPLRIEYPKGTYLPVIHPAPAHASSTRIPRTWWLASAGAIALVAIGAFAALRPPGPPVFAPIPTTWVEPNEDSLQTADVGLAEDVDADLANHSGTRVIAWPEIVRKKSLRLLALRDFASALGANRLVLLLVRGQGHDSLVRVFVIDEPSGLKRLALTYADATVSTPAQQDALAARIAAGLAPVR